ncbi:MAG: matrixin family metalloprotease [Chthoniobacterales bacterium]|nr:matrixin family metalloprotease [Chthoniobacterales bacterium]
MIFSLFRCLFLGACFSLAAGLCAPRVSGYALENKTWPTGTIIKMEMGLGSPGAPLQDGSVSWNDAAIPAINAWNAEMQNIQVETVLDSSKPAASGDGVNSAVFSNTVFGDSFGSGVLAVTYYSFQGRTFKEADIIFNSAQSFESYRGNLQFNSQGKCVCDIQRVFLHELGHALGLTHPDSAGQKVDAVMNSIVSNRSLLAPDDIQGIEYLYGAPASSPTPTPTPTPTPLPDTPSRLVNISTRMHVGTGDDVLIGGFIIQGTQLKKIILRAIGPSLTAGGVAGALQDPKMELYDSTGALIEANDNWQESLDSGEIVESGLAPSDTREAAIVTRLAPGNYTAVISGVNDTTGIGLVESFTLDTSATHAANISTRGRVGSGEEVLIGGFIVGGRTTKQIIVRALGPSLGGSGLTVLADPIVELHGSDGQLIASNDDWASGSQQSDIIATGLQPGDPREAALIATIFSGNYTAIVQGVGGGAGIGLVEIYDLDL